MGGEGSMMHAIKSLKNNRRKKKSYFESLERTKRIFTKDTTNLKRRKMSKIGLLRLQAKLKKQKKQYLILYIILLSVSTISLLTYILFL